LEIRKKKRQRVESGNLGQMRGYFGEFTPVVEARPCSVGETWEVDSGGTQETLQKRRKKNQPN